MFRRVFFYLAKNRFTNLITIEIMKIPEMNINNRFTGTSYRNLTQNILNKTAKSFSKMGHIGEGASIACDFFGKALIVPAIIMTVSKEPKDKKEFSAFKNPVAAVIQLALEVPLLAVGSKVIGNCADRGMFDVEGSDFSYNEKLKRKEFIDTFEKCTNTSENVSKDFLDELKSKGYSTKVLEQFDDIISNLDDTSKNTLKRSFKEYERTYKNQFHLKNRVCFLAALVLTPLLCAIENKLHPPIMEKIFKLQHLEPKTETADKLVSLLKFYKPEKLSKGVIK